MVLPVECVARAYLTGGGLREYAADGNVSGIRLPEGLVEASDRNRYRAVEHLALGVKETHQVLRPHFRDGHDHTGAIERIAVVEGNTRIERASAGRWQRRELAILEHRWRSFEEGAALPEHVSPH